MKLESVIGQTLDGKYKIEKELGRGGMGTVFLATHIGTERPVAVKIIAPQFMQRAEFVERFRREARAAGRLRHPNVVDVTDFGFSNTKDGSVAYLVMEYLDGCTLGEILEEEKKLPLGWSIDILEQVCSAVHEAHQQGIIHRDLKPENIWLEPNQRGGYTVKVLDFGIAKLEEAQIRNFNEFIHAPSTPTQEINKNTFAGESQGKTVADHKHSTVVSEAKTLAQTVNDNTPANQQTFLSEAGTLIQKPDEEVDLESGTAILPLTGDHQTEKISEQIITDKTSLEKISTAELTRVGAVLGTPLYMSPEQCGGEKLSPQSDIYSLGVIAYQMLSGETPFKGDYQQVMDAHKELAPPALKVKKVPKKVKQFILSALAKDPSERPPTAQAFAAELRAQSEGIGALLSRALVIYSQHLPKFLGLTIFIYIPIILATFLKVIASFLYVEEVITPSTNRLLSVIFTLVTTFGAIFCGYFVFGTTTWIVTQILAMPLRPVRVRPALKEAVRKWKTFAGTGMMSTAMTFLGYTLCLIPGFILSIFWALVAPVVMMENLRGRAALKRSKLLVKRSLRTTAAAIIIMFLVPAISGGVIGFFAATTVKSFSKAPEKTAEAKAENDTSEKTDVNNENAKQDDSFQINLGTGNKVEITDDAEEKPKIGGLNGALQEIMTTILTLPLQIFIASISSIIVALLYLKTRQAGGESMQDLLTQFEDEEQPRSNWQKRIRERIQQTGKLTSKS